MTSTLRLFSLVSTAVLAATIVACADGDPLGPIGNGIDPGDATITTDITTNRTFFAESTYTILGLHQGRE